MSCQSCRLLSLSFIHCIAVSSFLLSSLNDAKKLNNLSLAYPSYPSQSFLMTGCHLALLQCRDSTIYLRVHSHGLPDLTVLDLPGITRNAVEGQPENIEEIITAMINRHIEGTLDWR
jgi:hypothetical protein